MRRSVVMLQSFRPLSSRPCSLVSEGDRSLYTEEATKLGKPPPAKRSHFQPAVLEVKLESITRLDAKLLADLLRYRDLSL